LLQEIETIDYKKSVGIHEWFYVQAMQTPDRIALVCDGSVITYRELDIRSNRLAHYLIRLGVGPEVLVGICMERSPDIIIAILGILKAGGGYVPIDPTNPEERVAFILEDGGIKVLITSQPILSQFNNATTHLENTVLLDKIECDLQNENSEPPAIKIEPENVAYVIYTSGSTGMPKGVVVTHNNVTRLMAATEEWYNFSETDIWTYFHSTAFDFSVWEMWGALLYGGKLVIVSYTVSRSPRDFYRLLVEEQVTVLNQTPSAFGQLLPIDSELRGKLNLRYVILGGEALELSMLEDWFENHGDTQPRLINMYGITETTVHVTYRPLRKEDSMNKSGSIIGKPIRDLSLYLLDEQMEPVPTGVTGELYVGGAGLARCYLNRDELTKERFISNPFGSGRLYKTGDLARRLPDSDLEFIGRVDRQEKIRGFRIELGEIESVLLKSLGVQSAAVIVREDKPGDKRLTAYIVRKENNETATVESLHTSCQDRLPDYMVPGSLIFLPSLPLTSNGKLDYKALPEPNALADADDDCILPSTDLEKTLCSMWSEVLDVDPIGINQNFFELGGHSLVATQLISRIRVKFSIELSITSLFDEPTVEGLAKIITEEQTKQEQITTTPILKAKKKKTKQITLSDDGNII
jgi:amino acid adenylation domain-containing protein